MAEQKPDMLVYDDGVKTNMSGVGGCEPHSRRTRITALNEL